MIQPTEELTEEQLVINMTRAISADNVERIENEAEQAEEEVQKRGRGRPKGSRSKSPKREAPPPQKEIEKPPTDLAALKFKIKCFLNSKFMQTIIGDEIRAMPEKTPEQCIEKLRCISQARNLNFKKSMVGKMFNAMCGLVEEGTKFYMPYMDGFASDVEEHKELFDQDLEELAIDLSDSWVPGPTIRILSGLMVIMNERRKMYWTYEGPISNKLKSSLKKKDDNRKDN